MDSMTSSFLSEVFAQQKGEVFNLQKFFVKDLSEFYRQGLITSTSSLSVSSSFFFNLIVNDDNTLTIQPPKLDGDQLPTQYAFVFKLTGLDLDIQP